MRSISILVSCSLALSACDGGAGTAADAGRLDASGADSGSPVDASADASRVDGGPAGDPCIPIPDEWGEVRAVETVGCNGAILGPSTEPDSFGGLCTPSDTDPAGSCTGADALCFVQLGALQGICASRCTPSPGARVSTGGCPTGSRCFDLRSTSVGESLCFPDCNEDADCATLNCDGEGSCVQPPRPGAGTDGGILDGGIRRRDAGVDAGRA